MLDPYRSCTAIFLLRRQTTLRAYDTHHILIRDWMSQADSLRQVLRTRTPDQRILEAVLQRPVDRIADILNVAALSDDERLVETRLNTLALGVNAHELEFFPTPLDNFLDSEIKLTRHDSCVRFARKVVEMLQADAVDFVVDVETLDVRSVVFHDDVDKLVDGRCNIVSKFGTTRCALVMKLFEKISDIPSSSRIKTSQFRIR